MHRGHLTELEVGNNKNFGGLSNRRSINPADALGKHTRQNDTNTQKHNRSPLRSES